MRFIFRTAEKDMRRRLADPLSLLFWIGIPTMVGGLLTLMAGGDGPAPKAHVLVVDLDDSFLSKLLLGAVGGSELLEMESVTLEEGQKRIDEGDGTALLIMPAGFADAVLDSKPTRLELITNPAQRILPGIVEEGLDMLVEATFYGQRVFAGPIAAIRESVTDGGATDASVASISVEINQLFATAAETLSPPVLVLEQVVEEKPDAEPVNFGLLFVPGILFMSLIFVGQGMSDDVWAEKQLGTLRRLVSTPQTTTSMLAGKLLAAAVVMMAVSLIGGALAVFAFDAKVGVLPLAIIWSTFTGVAMMTIFILIQLYGSTRRMANVLSSVVMFPLLILGGSFFPFEAMPSWMVRVGQWTPNGLAVARLKEILVGDPDPKAMLVAGTVIGLAGCIAFAISVRRLRGTFLTS